MTLKETLFLDFPRDWKEPTGAGVVARRKALWHLLSPSVKRTMHQMLPSIREARATVIGKYLSPLEDEVELAADVELADTSAQLLRTASITRQDPIRIQQRYEALQLWDMATALAVLAEDDPLTRVRADLRRLVDLFKQKIFAPASLWVNTWSYHDPSDELRVRHVALRDPLPKVDQGQWLRRHSPLNFRVTADGQLVSFHHRDKHVFGVWLKVYRQLHDATRVYTDPYVVTDRCGIKLIVPTVEDVQRVVDQIADALAHKKVQGSIKKVYSNLGATQPMNGANSHSSPHYHAAKYQLFAWGREYELQVTTLADYFASRYALGSENHLLYRLDQILEVFGPLLFPTAVYNSIDWTSPELRSILMGQAVGKLVWQFSPRIQHRLTQSAMQTWLSSPA